MISTSICTQFSHSCKGLTAPLGPSNSYLTRPVPRQQLIHGGCTITCMLTLTGNCIPEHNYCHIYTQTSSFICYCPFICQYEWSDAGATAALCGSLIIFFFVWSTHWILISKAKNLLTFVPFLSQGFCINEAENTFVFLCRVSTANL